MNNIEDLDYTSDHTNEITAYWDWCETLPNDVKEIALRQWDQWGEGVRHIAISIGELINISDNYDDFKTKYFLFMNGPYNTKKLYQLDTEAETYYHIYMAGMNRVKNELVMAGLI